VHVRMEGLLLIDASQKQALFKALASEDLAAIA
jgi:hypothetical protein